MVDATSDEHLMLRLRRLAAAAQRATRRDDRRRLLALQSDLQAVRAELQARCRMLVEKIDTAGARFSAVSAYARCASLQRNTAEVRVNGKARGN